MWSNATFCACLAVLQNCGLVIPVTSSAAVDTVSLTASNAMATQTVWTIQMRRLVVSVPQWIVSLEHSGDNNCLSHKKRHKWICSMHVFFFLSPSSLGLVRIKNCEFGHKLEFDRMVLIFSDPLSQRHILPLLPVWVQEPRMCPASLEMWWRQWLWR